MTEKEMLEKELFILDMKDHHNAEDREKRDDLVRRIREMQDDGSSQVF